MDGDEKRYSGVATKEPPPPAYPAEEYQPAPTESTPVRRQSDVVIETNVDTRETATRSYSPTQRASRTSSGPTCNMSDAKVPLMIVGVVVGIALLLVIILVPISFSTLEYYELGFMRRKSTGEIDRDQAYGPGGRHFIGPDYEFRTLKADAHFENFNRVSVFAKDRLQVTITASMQYFLRKDQMALLHKKYDARYEPIILTNGLNALKNRATAFETREFIRNRTYIENELFLAVRNMLSGPCCEKDCAQYRTCVPGCEEQCDESQYGFYVDVRYFQLDALDIPGDLETKFLDNLVLKEQTEAEQYKQDATVVRKQTDAEVKQIENEAREISATATAESELIRSMAQANATAIVENARSEGLKHLYSELGITEQKQKASFDYLRTLRGQKNIHMAIDFQQLIAGGLSPSQ